MQDMSVSLTIMANAETRAVLLAAVLFELLELTELTLF